MPVTPDDLAALEERLLAKLQPSRAEEVDLPAAVYSRVMCLTAALLVYVCASMLVSSFTTGVVGNLSQIEYLVFPLCFTAQFGLMFGALDSDAAGRRTIKLMRAWWIPQIFIVPYLYWSSGMQEDAVLLFVGFAINSIYWPWLLNAQGTPADEVSGIADGVGSALYESSAAAGCFSDRARRLRHRAGLTRKGVVPPGVCDL